MSFPQNARLFALQPHKKIPVAGSRGHLDALPAKDFGQTDGNYGIALDKQYLLVDIDRPDDPIAVEWGLRLPSTWTQKTPRGTHRLYALPEGFDGKNARFPAGDLKVHGYLVGPGSEVDGNHYYTLDEREPTEAPPWLLAMVDRARPDSTLVNGELVLHEREKIAIGENDVELFSLACGFRRKGFTEAAIADYIRAIIDSGLVEQIPGNEYHERDILRIAKQAARYDPELGDIGLFDEEWVCAADIALVGPPIKWWIRHYIPRGELVTLYGAGGIGKSSWASWLAAEVTRKGGKFVFIGVEESFQRFASRAVLGGADRTKLFSIPNAHNFTLPKDADTLKDQVMMMDADVVYFDSIYSHFGSVAGENAAERARKSLAPLANIALTTGTTIIAVFHENKAGTYLGSTEMINVARYALCAQRQGAQPLKIWVAKTNFVDPGEAMQFLATDMELRDTETNQVQLEEMEDGSLQPMHVKVLHRGENTMLGELEEEDKAGSRIRQIVQLLEDNPTMSASAVFDIVGGHRADVMAIVKGIKEQ
jgi:hypothetical protein